MHTVKLFSLLAALGLTSACSVYVPFSGAAPVYAVAGIPITAGGTGVYGLPAARTPSSVFYSHGSNGVWADPYAWYLWGPASGFGGVSYVPRPVPEFDPFVQAAPLPKPVPPSAWTPGQSRPSPPLIHRERQPIGDAEAEPQVTGTTASRGPSGRYTPSAAPPTRVTAPPPARPTPARSAAPRGSPPRREQVQR